MKPNSDDIVQQNENSHQISLITILNKVAANLLHSEVETFNTDLWNSMDIIAKAVNADRVYIWKNVEKEDGLHCFQMHEWSEGATPQQDSDFTSDVSYKDIVPEWEEWLGKGNCVKGIVSKLSPNEQAALSPQGILSILVAPIFVLNKFWGFVGFDDCHNERVFDEDEEMILRSVSQYFVDAIIHNATIRETRSTAAQLEAIIANYPGIIWSVNQEGTITLFNGLALNKLGIPPSFIKGKNIDVIRNSPLHTEIVKRIDNTFTEGEQDWISKIRGRVYHTRSIPIYDEKKRVAMAVGGINDITDLIQLQDELEIALKNAQEASRAKSNFLAKISHEIRTPMNAIIGMTELALREDMTAAAREHTLTIKQASQNLLSIINDILDFSKIESGNMEINPKEYRISSLVHDVVSIIRTRIHESRLRFLVNMDSNLPNTLFGDEIRIRQIILNLLGNAVKYTEKGFMLFSVTAKQVSEDSLTLVMEITDSGRGIREEDMENMFGDFVQLDTDNNTGIEGTGLGLAITRSLVKAMGGEIKVSSKYGKGSTFIVTLPQKIINLEKVASVQNPEEKRVLVYERRKIHADSILETIDNLGISCTLAETSSDYYEKLLSNEYSFVFLSIKLYEEQKKKFPTLESKARFTLITEFGESVPYQNISILHTPIYSIPVSMILNSAADNVGYGNFSTEHGKFIAPDARVLIVDDIYTNLKVAEGLLLPYKMQIDLCKSGEAAIKAARSKKYDLVFMDHKMPKMDGIEATKRIRALESKDAYYKNLTIIALTANAISGTKEMFLANGFNDFLTKPIEIINLNDILEKWIPFEKRGGMQENISGNAGLQNKAGVAIELKIEGIDTERGITLSGGRIESYWEILSIYYRDGKEKLREIRACLKKGNLPLYTVLVHAMKSASANIGANELSARAKALEAAGENKDTVFIEKNNGEFLSALEILLNNIDKERTAYNNLIQSESSPVDKEMFKAELLKLKTALESLDAGTINKTVDSLQKYKGAKDIDVLIENISEKILCAEFDESITLINGFLEG